MENTYANGGKQNKSDLDVMKKCAKNVAHTVMMYGGFKVMSAGAGLWGKVVDLSSPASDRMVKVADTIGLATSGTMMIAGAVAVGYGIYKLNQDNDLKGKFATAYANVKDSKVAQKVGKFAKAVQKHTSKGQDLFDDNGKYLSTLVDITEGKDKIKDKEYVRQVPKVLKNFMMRNLKRGK